MKNSSAGAWEEMKKGFADAFESMGEASDKAVEEFEEYQRAIACPQIPRKSAYLTQLRERVLTYCPAMRRARDPGATRRTIVEVVGSFQGKEDATPSVRVLKRGVRLRPDRAPDQVTRCP
ncbi:MAG: hypothetical protein V2I24_01010 [Halieaceae bacterium]|jgi:hypothetical protein|nr:hypothetical protein [Halieaceae bacterium]